MIRPQRNFNFHLRSVLLKKRSSSDMRTFSQKSCSKPAQQGSHSKKQIEEAKNEQMSSRGGKSKGSSSNNTRSSGGVKFLLHAPLRNNQHTPVDNNKWCFTGGYVGLFGDLMDNYTPADDSLIPESYKQNQRDRDGNQYHMTIMLKNDFKRLAERVDEMFAETIDKIEAREKGTLPKGFQDNKGIRFLYVMSELISRDDFKDMGIGKVNQGPEEAFFRVIDWQSANQFLEKVGMARKDFHVTLGFKAKDIHNVSKNIHTLVRPQ